MLDKGWTGMPEMTDEDRTTETHSARFLGWFLLLFGLLEVGAVILCTVFLPDPWWVFFCITVPGSVLAIILLLNGWASSLSSITMTPDRLTLRVPTWRATQTPPMQVLDAPWSAVRGVDCRTEFYLLPPFGLFPTIAYRIRTTDRAVIIGGRQFLGNRKIMDTIVRRSRLSLTVCEDVQMSLWATLHRNQPPWIEA